MNKHAIVLGDSFNNTLGFLRSLGQVHVRVSLILIGEEDRLFVRKCRYISQLFRVKEWDEALSIIPSIGIRESLLLCTNDPAAQWVDTHEEMLSKWVTTPMNGRHLGPLFTKGAQCRLAAECGLPVPQTAEYHRGDPIPTGIPYPLLIKPFDSLLGEKDDIHVCRTPEDFAQALLQDSRCGHFLVQQFVEKDCELNLLGVSTSHGVYIPGAALKERYYPNEYGSSSYGSYRSAKELNLNLEPIVRMMERTGYHGPFSVELLRQGGTDYFLEINFRNDRMGYFPTAAGCNLPALLFQPSAPKSLPLRPLRWMDLGLDFNLVKARKISLLHWLRDLLCTRCQLNFNLRDPMPTVYYYLNKLLNLTHQSFHINIIPM